MYPWMFDPSYLRVQQRQPLLWNGKDFQTSAYHRRIERRILVEHGYSELFTLQFTGNVIKLDVISIEVGCSAVFESLCKNSHGTAISSTTNAESNWIQLAFDPSNMELSCQWGIPKMDGFLREHPIYKWMMTGGTPMT